MTRSRRSSVEVRSEIVRAAEVAFATHGYEAVRLNQIARDARTPESVLYRYFPSKAALFREAVLHPVLDVLRAFASASARYVEHPLDSRSLVRLVLSELLEQLTVHRAAVRSFVSVEEGLTSDEREEFHGAMVDLIHQLEDVAGAAVSKRRADVDWPTIQWATRLGLAMVLSIVVHDRWLLAGFTAPPSHEETVEHVTDFLLRAIGAPG